MCLSTFTQKDIFVENGQNSQQIPNTVTKAFCLKLEIGHPVPRLSWLKYSPLLTTLLCYFLILQQWLTCKAAAAQAAFIVALGRSHNPLLNQTICCVWVFLYPGRLTGDWNGAWMLALKHQIWFWNTLGLLCTNGKKIICGLNRLTEKFTYRSRASAQTAQP